MTLRTAGLSSRVCGSLLTRPVTLSDLTSPLRASLKCKTKIIRKLQIVYISRSCDQEQPQVNSCEALRIVVGKKETKCMLTTQLQAKQCWKKEDNLSTKNFISAFALIQGWHNLKKSTINNRAAMFLIPHFFARICSQCSFYVFLTRGGSVGTRREKQFFLPFPYPVW